MNRRGILLVCAMLIAMLAAPFSPAHAVRIKIATKAPKNFTSSKIVNQMTQEIAEKTDEQVKFKIYYGGVKGSGRDLLLKMKAGEIQGGEFTAGEASTVCADLRIMNIPLTFSNYEEVDFVMEKITPIFQEQLLKNGYVVLGWLEVGFAYLMSTDPIANLGDMKGKKVWIPQGDPVGQAAFEAMGVPPIPLTIADVMVALQTGQINTVANSFVGAIALQWYTRVKYVTDKPLLYVYGLLMISKKAHEKIPEKYRGTVQEIVDKHLAVLKTDIRKSNKESRETLKKQGISFVPVTPADYGQLKSVITAVNKELAGKDFSEATLKEMQKYLDEYRAAHPEGAK
jgi:TRAP-type C4-dicarboxylate transport system substrate-binding protein